MSFGPQKAGPWLSIAFLLIFFVGPILTALIYAL